MATTKTSSSEFLHPTTTPGRLDLMSVGQNMRINPSCSGMTSMGPRRALEGAAPLQLLSSRDSGSWGTRVLVPRYQPAERSTKTSRSGFGSYQVRFPRRQPFHKGEDEQEEEGEDDGGYGGSGLRRERGPESAKYVVFAIEGSRHTYDDAVVPGEDGKLVETCDEVPAGCDVASYEDSQGQDGEGVHRIAGRRSRMPRVLLDQGSRRFVVGRRPRGFDPAEVGLDGRRRSGTRLRRRGALIILSSTRDS